MNNVFVVKDKLGKNIYLTKGRWRHIISSNSLHSYMTDYLEEIKETLIYPNKIMNSINDDKKVNYYKHYKKKKQYLKVIVKYLNGDGFVISAYFVRNIV